MKKELKSQNNWITKGARNLEFNLSFNSGHGSAGEVKRDQIDVNSKNNTDIKINETIMALTKKNTSARESPFNMESQQPTLGVDQDANEARKGM